MEVGMVGWRNKALAGVGVTMAILRLASWIATASSARRNDVGAPYSFTAPVRELT